MPLVRRSRLLAGWLLVVPIVAASGQEPAPMPVADAELLRELEAAPPENSNRVSKLRCLFEQAGAPAEAITMQEVAGRRPDDPLQHNVIVTKPGETDEVIVVGGHLDKVEPGHGVIDDWSGASMTTNLYQAMKDVPTRHTFVFVGFAYEEQGLVGSRLFVEELGEEGVEAVRAMVNLECLGVGGPFLWTNGSNDDLEAIAHRVAEEHERPLEDHVIRGVGADSIPFEEAGIPTITFDGLPMDRFELIHSDLDRFENIDPEVYRNSYDLVLKFLVELDRSDDLPEAAGLSPADSPEPLNQE